MYVVLYILTFDIEVINVRKCLLQKFITSKYNISYRENHELIKLSDFCHKHNSTILNDFIFVG